MKIARNDNVLIFADFIVERGRKLGILDESKILFRKGVTKGTRDRDSDIKFCSDVLKHIARKADLFAEVINNYNDERYYKLKQYYKLYQEIQEEFICS